MAVAAIGATVAGWFGAATVSTAIASAIGGAIIGAAIGGLTALVSGGDLGKGLLMGAVGGAVMGGVSGWMQGGTVATGVEGTATAGMKAGTQVIQQGGNWIAQAPSTVTTAVNGELGKFSQKEALELMGQQGKEAAMWGGVAQAAPSALQALMAPSTSDQLELEAGRTDINIAGQERLLDREEDMRMALLEREILSKESEAAKDRTMRREEINRPYEESELARARQATGLKGLSTQSFLEDQLNKEAY